MAKFSRRWRTPPLLFELKDTFFGLVHTLPTLPMGMSRTPLYSGPMPSDSPQGFGSGLT